MNEEYVENSHILLDRLTNLITKAIRKLEDDKFEIDSLNQVNKSLEEFAAKESNSKIELIEENNELKAKLDNLAGNNSYYNDLVKSLELNIEQNAHYKIEYEHIREKYEKMLLENAELKDQVNKIPGLNLKIEEQNSSISELDLLNKSYLNTIGKYERALVDKELIQKDLASKNIRIYELLNEIESQKEKVALYESQLLKLKENDKLINNYKSRISELEIEFTSKLEDLKNNNYQISVENAQLKDELNNSKIEIGIVEDEKVILENKNHELRESIDILQKELDETGNSISNLNIQIENLNVELNRLNKINQSYVQEFEILKSNNEVNNKELKLAQEEISNLNTFKSELIEEIDRLDKLIYEKDNEINALNEEIKQHKNNLDNLKATNEEIVGKISHYEIEIDNLKSEIGSAHNEKIVEYTNNINQLERINTDLQFQVEESQNELTQKIRDIKLLQDRMAEFINETNRLKNELAERNVKLSIFSANEGKNLTRISNLEELVKTRYEQINLLENKINILLDEKSRVNESKKTMIDLVKSTINDIDAEIKALKSK